MSVLADLRVVELSRTAAAAFAGRLFADSGAEVVLVEPPEGHPLRAEGPFKDDRPHPETSAAHLHVNAGKRSVTLDIQERPQLLRRLVLGADVFVTDYPTEELAAAGADWRDLSEVHPGLLMAHVTPFGATGPYRTYTATNIVCMALGGQLKITGDPSPRPPLCNFGSQAEYQAGLAAFAGAVASLLLRDAGGGGAYLDLSVQDIVANNLEGRSLTFNLDVMAERAGLNVSAVYGVYPCAGGWVFISAFAPPLWEALKAAAQLPALADERFSTQAGRLENNDELQAIITGWTLSRTADELRELARQGYPLTVAETPQRLLESEQWRVRGVVHTVRHPAAGSIAVLGPPWLDSERPPPAPAPRLGEANDDVLTGLSEAVT